ncbi:MAG: 6-hydroxymethylpterin diphosphokinase MptE-like protein [Spirochaetota bacterium]
MNLLDANLAALPHTLARAIEAAAPRPDEVVVAARDGSRVNGLARPRRPALFHSGYAPLREAERLADTAGDAGFVVVLGMGACHHIRAIAARGRRVLVVEPDLRLVRSAFTRDDLTGLLRSRSVALADPSNLGHDVSTRYCAPVDGDLAVVELPGRVSAEPDAFDPYRRALGRIAERLRTDLAVQARFGLRWMRNTILNIPAAHARTLPSWSGEVHVAAAGPSLADALPHLAADASTPLLAVDTALPVMLAHRVRPDLVVSIDCQAATYQHYLTAGFPDVPVAAELSMLPSLFAGLSARHPVRSDHPLHTLIGALGLDAPYLDARGGNVTQAAVDLAVRLGARRIRVFGADFSYPDGETYPRGSYLHRLFTASSSRLAPLAGRHYGFLLDRPGVRRDRDEPARWVQPLLSAYAERFADFAGGLSVGVTRVRGRGAPLDVRAPATAPERPGGGAVHEAAGGRAPAAPPRTVLERLRETMRAVSVRSRFTQTLESPEGESLESALAARALLPALTHLRADGEAVSFDELLERAHERLNSYVCAALERCEDE